MGILLSAALHNYQPFRDLHSVTLLPLEKRNGTIAPRNLIPFPDGKPAQDWNLNHVLLECYEPCAERGVYGLIPFNFGPPLITELKVRAPKVHRQIVESEKRSFDRFGGHSNAIAQASPNHAILPLANGDKSVHAWWGVEEYVDNFGRYPEGIWLPECAVDKESLITLADLGIKYVILSPEQALRFRPIGTTDWKDPGWKGVNLDTSKPYKAYLGEENSGKNIVIFFFDKDLAFNVAYPTDQTRWMYDSSENFLHRWLGGKGDFKHFAVDGETFGHHLKEKALVLAGALWLIENKKNDWQGAEFTNYGLYLEQNPPQNEVEVIDNSSWSCAHGTVRWGETKRVQKEHNGHTWVERVDCSCGAIGSDWRIQMRNALDDLAVRLDLVYKEFARQHLKDPEQAIKDYCSVVSYKKSFGDFFEINKTPNGDINKAYMLLEMQKFKLYMFTSCGWFHQYVSRIEPFANFICANTAIRIASQFVPKRKIEEDFLNRLSPDMISIYKQAKDLNGKLIAA